MTGRPRAAAGLLVRLHRDRRGVIAVIFALAIVPMIAAGGAAIDISRAYLVRQRLGFAVDAAGLAVGSSSGTEAELNLVMRRYFEANYPAGEIGVPATPTMTIVDNVVTVSASAEVDATLMQVVGVHTITVSASTQVIRETKGLDVVLVLDNTGSMSGSRLTALKSASRAFTEILFGDQATPELLQIGIVPFNTTVNIGTGMRTPYTRGPGNAQYSPDTWGGCVEARADRTPRRDSTDDWVENNAHKWRRYLYPSDSSQNNWPSLSGDRGQFRGPNKECPVALLPLTNVKADVLAKIDQMEANGFTHINIGAVWGWRVISPAEPFTQGRPYGDPEFNKAVVVMTDGENAIQSTSGTYGAYGEPDDHSSTLGTSSSGAKVTELNARTLEVCTAMKALGIIVYTITFQVGSNSARNLMRDCATDAGKYFDSPSNAELERSFRAIGAQLSNLRIGR